MISLKECNTQIKAFQMYIQNSNNMTDAGRIAIYETLTFNLDTRALLVMKGCNDKTTKEEEN